MRIVAQMVLYPSFGLSELALTGSVALAGGVALTGSFVGSHLLYASNGMMRWLFKRISNEK